MKDAKLPRQHKFILHSIKEQTLGVFSQTVGKFLKCFMIHNYLQGITKF